MTTDIRELLREVAPQPRADLDLDGLLDAVRRRRRRTRMRLAVLVAGVLIVPAAALGAALVSQGTTQGRVRISAPAPFRGVGVSLSVPAGWRTLPRIDGGDPTEILVVGTADRPASTHVGSSPVLVPLEACAAAPTPPGSAVYVTVYAYAPSDPSDQGVPSPTGDGTVVPDATSGRPGTFSLDNGLGADCAAPSGQPQAQTTDTVVSTTTAPSTPARPTTTTTTTTSPPTSTPSGLANHWRQYVFSEGGRVYAARVVSVGDPSATLLKQGLTVLNTLQFESSGPAQSSTTTTTIGVRPADPVAARQAIQDAFNSAYDNQGPLPQADSVEGGFPLSSATQQAGRNANPSDAGGAIVVRINWLQYIDATHATVNFDLLVNGQPITATTTGEVLVEDGIWKIARSTYCGIIDRGSSIACPS